LLIFKKLLGKNLIFYSKRKRFNQETDKKAIFNNFGKSKPIHNDLKIKQFCRQNTQGDHNILEKQKYNFLFKGSNNSKKKNKKKTVYCNQH
jgi:hypothetical protein